MRTLAVGDIHGCYRALTSLMALVQPQPGDQVVFLGDYIDRGPDSRAVLEWMISQREQANFKPVFLRGNHEVMILRARHNLLEAKLWGSYGGFEMLISYGAEYRKDWQKAIPEAHWEFFKHTERYFETGTHIFVHAMLEPGVDLVDQVDRVLYWELFDGIQPHKSGKKIICGHTAQRAGLINDLGFATCIDTDVFHHGWLTCLDTGSGYVWQANEKGETRTGSLND